MTDEEFFLAHHQNNNLDIDTDKLEAMLERVALKLEPFEKPNIVQIVKARLQTLVEFHYE